MNQGIFDHNWWPRRGNERMPHPQLTDSEREVIAHLFEVVFEILTKADLIPKNIDPQLVEYEMNRFRTGHLNENGNPLAP